MPPIAESQIIAAFQKAQKPLIVFKKNFSADGLAGALALFLFFQKIGKAADVASDGFVLPKNYKFLPAAETVKSELNAGRKLIISVDISKININQFHYDIVGDELKIYLWPRGGFFGPRDIKAAAADWPYDLIITVDSPNLEALGAIYTTNREFFSRRPIINLDCSADNENFGAINLVDKTASAVCAVVYNLIKTNDKNLLDADINTCLLAGIIDKTKGFKAGLINPQTLQIASELIENGGRREEIIKHLYYNRDLNTVKLWGRTLVKLKEYFGGRLVSAALTLEDFAETKSAPGNLADIIDELISTIPGLELIVLIYQPEKTMTEILIKSHSAFNPQEVLKRFAPVGDKNLIKIKIKSDDLALIEKEIIAEIKKGYKPTV